MKARKKGNLSAIFFFLVVICNDSGAIYIDDTNNEDLISADSAISAATRGLTSPSSMPFWRKMAHEDHLGDKFQHKQLAGKNKMFKTLRRKVELQKDPEKPSHSRNNVRIMKRDNIRIMRKKDLGDDVRIMKKDGDNMRIMKKDADGWRIMKRDADDWRIMKRDVNNMRIMKRNLDDMRIMKRKSNQWGFFDALYNFWQQNVAGSAHSNNNNYAKRDPENSGDSPPNPYGDLRIMKKDGDNMRIMKKDADGWRIMKRDSDDWRIMKRDVNNMRIMKKNLDDMRIMKRKSNQWGFFDALYNFWQQKVASSAHSNNNNYAKRDPDNSGDSPPNSHGDLRIMKRNKILEKNPTELGDLRIMKRVDEDNLEDLRIMRRSSII